MKPVTIADYGVGNLQSVARAIEFCGGTACVTSDPQLIARAERLLLPGVGAFGDGMKGLQTTGILEGLFEFAATERPFLGICLGMQMLMQSSDEFGHQKGLGFIEGDCIPVPRQSENGAILKIPHMGWNELLPPHPNRSWDSTPFENVQSGEEAYFVHSWMVNPRRPEVVIAVTDYGGHRIPAAINDKQFWGCQFHPEKSGRTGLKIISSFIAR